MKNVEQAHVRSPWSCTWHFALCTRHFALRWRFAALPSNSVELRANPAHRWFGLLLCVLCGCGRREDSTAEVLGDVKFCGQPAIAEILFEPVNDAGKSIGRASTATSNEGGHFRLMLDDSRFGAKIGRHRVTIRVHRLRGASEKPAPSRDGVIGTLKATRLLRDVRPANNDFQFWLTY